MFTLTFTPAAGNVADLAAAVSAGTMTAVAGNTAAAAAIESQDRYVFEATAALNGVDVINNFNLTGAPTDDILVFSKFLPGNYDTNFAVNSTVGIDLSGGGNATQDIAVMFNKATPPRRYLVNTAFVAGKIGLADNGKAVVLVTADDDGFADVVTNNPYDVLYYVEDTDTAVGATAQTFAVTKVATVNSAAELNAFAFVNMGRVLTGTAAADFMAGGGGADRIQGNGGADNITLGFDAAADTVVYAAKTDGTTLGVAVGSADAVANFVSANDTVALTGALKALVDDITIDNGLVFGVAAGGSGLATAVDLVTTVEALFIDNLENGGAVTAANLGNKTLVLNEFDDEFTETVAVGGGSDALLVLESSTVGTFGVDHWKDDIGNGFDSFDELVLLGIVTGDTVTTANFSLI